MAYDLSESLDIVFKNVKTSSSSCCNRIFRAGTSTVKRAFEHIFAREDIVPAVVEGDSYHRFERMPMKKAMADALSKGENFSHFGPEANLFDKLEELLKSMVKLRRKEKILST